MFAKYPNKKAAEEAIELLRRKSPTCKSNIAWCNFDRPANVRIPLQLLFKLKKLLIGWGFQKRAIQLSEDTYVMKVGDMPVAKMTAYDGNLNLEWLNDEWEHWQELHDSEELQTLLPKGREDLASVHQRQIKGLGKGKTHAV